MARGNSNFEHLKLFFLKIKGLKKGETVHIEQEESQGKDQKPKKLLKEDGTPDTITEVSGVLDGVYIREGEYEGNKIHELKMNIVDQLAGERLLLSCGMNSIGRDLMNQLLNIDSLGGEMQLRVYMNKSGYPAVYFEYRGQKLGWKYDWTVQSSMVDVNTIKQKGKDVTTRDFYRLEEKLINEIKEKFMKSDQPATTATAPVAETTRGARKAKAPATAPVAAGGDDDDLPF